jgi:hypothetical protein
MEELLVRRGRDRMVVGFTTTCTISGNHHKRCELQSRSWRVRVLDTTLCDKVSMIFSSFLHQYNGPP